MFLSPFWYFGPFGTGEIIFCVLSVRNQNETFVDFSHKFISLQIEEQLFKPITMVMFEIENIVGCGQISLLLMLKTHSTVQRGSNSLFNETHLFIFSSFHRYIYVYLISVSLS